MSALEQLARDLHERVDALDRALATGDVAVDVQDGELHVRRLPGADRPATTTALAAHIASRLPQVDLAGDPDRRRRVDSLQRRAHARARRTPTPAGCTNTATPRCSRTPATSATPAWARPARIDPQVAWLVLLPTDSRTRWTNKRGPVTPSMKRSESSTAKYWTE
jgi:hypothetical protein